MVVANEQAHLKKVLSDTIPLLCKSSLGLFNSSFSVEAIVGITVNETDVLLVSFKETVLPDGSTISLTWQRDGVDTVVTTSSSCSYSDNKEDTNNEATSANDNTQVLYDDTNSGSNEVLESMEEAQFVSSQASIKQPPYEEDDWKQVEEYSYQATYTRDHATEAGEEDGLYKYSAEPADWESVGRALQSEPSVGDVDEIDCSIVKIEKHHEIEMDFGSTPPGKPGLKPNRDEAMRSGHALSQRGLRRRGLASSRRVVPRSGLQFAQKRLQVRKQPAMTSRTANKHSSVSSRVQQWSGDASASQGTPQDPYESMADVLCRTAMQQSTVTVEKQYICRICQARLSSTNNLMAHIQGTHLALDRYQCHICLEKFRWYMQLHRHRKRCHSDMFPPSTL